MGVIADRIAAARRGANPNVVALLRSGWAVMGDQQYLRGYCVLLSDPPAPTLNDLDGEMRRLFLEDMAALGDAVLAVTRPSGAVRINYSIYGNLEPQLHAHVFPRYEDEPEDLRTQPPWFYPESQQRARPFDAARDQTLMRAIKAELQWLGVVA